MATLSIPVNNPQEIYLSWYRNDDVSITLNLDTEISYATAKFVCRNLIQRKKVIDLNTTNGITIVDPTTIRIDIGRDDNTYTAGRYTTTILVTDLYGKQITYYTGILDILE